MGHAVWHHPGPKVLILNSFNDRETCQMKASDFVLAICKALHSTWSMYLNECNICNQSMKDNNGNEIKESKAKLKKKMEDRYENDTDNDQEFKPRLLKSNPDSCQLQQQDICKYITHLVCLKESEVEVDYEKLKEFGIDVRTTEIDGGVSAEGKPIFTAKCLLPVLFPLFD